MSPARRPSWWPTATFTAKAGWLCSAGFAKDFTEACSMLAKLPRPKRQPDCGINTINMTLFLLLGLLGSCLIILAREKFCA